MELTKEILLEHLKITAGFLGWEEVDEGQSIFAFRFKEEFPTFSGCFVENFFIENLKVFRRLNLATKIVGTSILIFRKSDS